jgi:predicted nucleotidyltransferase
MGKMGIHNMFTGENYPIESDMIETLDGEFYDVIGFDHPTERVIGYIKYFPITEEIQNAESIREVLRNSKTYKYGKIYDLKNRQEWIQKNHPDYIFCPKNYDFSWHAIPTSKIKTHYRPNLKLSELNNLREANQQYPKLHTLYNDAVDFCHILSKASGVSLNHIGITGSLLSNTATEQSDLDIVVYGFLNSLKIREVLRTIFQQNEPNSEIKRYSKEELKSLYTQRAYGTSLTFYEFLKYEFRKLHQGKFRGRDFFIRFFEYEHRMEYFQQNRFDRQQIRILGRAKITAQVRGDEHWWTTPARLEISNINYLNTFLKSDADNLLARYHLNLKQLSRTYTIRGRMIENARLLEGIIAEGTLELIIPESDPAYLQISFGADPADYLKQA